MKILTVCGNPPNDGDHRKEILYYTDLRPESADP